MHISITSSAVRLSLRATLCRMSKKDALNAFLRASSLVCTHCGRHGDKAETVETSKYTATGQFVLVYSTSLYILFLSTRIHSYSFTLPCKVTICTARPITLTGFQTEKMINFRTITEGSFGFVWEIIIKKRHEAAAIGNIPNGFQRTIFRRLP